MENVGIVAADQVGRDKITVGNISDSYTAIGEGAQVIVNHIEQALSQVDELEKSLAIAEKQLAQAIQRKIMGYTRLNASETAAERHNPYKSLLSYEVEDAPFFYGRTAAIAAMRERMRRGRLTILESDSGSGKTSLLKAGLSSRFVAGAGFSLYIRPYNLSPTVAIKKAFLPDYDTRIDLHPFEDDSMGLHGFLERVSFYLGGRELAIFLDQFEEFFNELDPQSRQKFADELHRCIQSDLPVRWVMAMRKEYLSELRLFEALKPFDNRYFLPAFRIEEAQEVIIEPAALKGMTYEDGLVEQIMADIGRDAETISPVQAQLVCYALFEELDQEKGENVISHRLYESPRGRKPGKPGAEGILASHLTRVLDSRLTSGQRKIALTILGSLVTYDGRRAVKTGKVLAAKRELAGELHSKVLEILVENRILRVERDENDEKTYELAHDYLLQEIAVDPDARARKLAQEILDREVAAWKENKHLRIPQDKLAMLNVQQGALAVNSDAQHLLDLSHKAHRHARVRNIGSIVLATIIIAVISTLAVTGQIPRLIYRPIEPGWIEIPAGEFLIGSSDEEVTWAGAIEENELPEMAFYILFNEQPQHEVHLDSFDIAKYEVSNKEYNQCVRSTICSPPSNDLFHQSQFASFPVTDVNYGQAVTYCEWVGGRLPTEAEWEKAARFGHETKTPQYAWGDEIDPMKAHVFAGSDNAPLAVGSYSPDGDTAVGLVDMTGNVWEWVSDWYADDYYEYGVRENPTGPPNGDWRIVRGGSCCNDWIQARVPFRNSSLRPGDSAADVGFRCVH